MLFNWDPHFLLAEQWIPRVRYAWLLPLLMWVCFLLSSLWFLFQSDLPTIWPFSTRALYKENDGIHVEGNVFAENETSVDDEVSLIPNGLEPIPLTAVLLEKNGWLKDECEPNAYIHPKLGTSNKIFIKDVPVIHDFEVPYVHLLQNVLTLLDENITRISP